MDDYLKLVSELNKQAFKDARKSSIKQYLLNNWIAIAALIVAIIALFK